MIDWFIQNIKAILVTLLNYLIDLVNMVIDALATFAVSVVSLLPSGGLTAPPLSFPNDYPVLGWLNWFFPVSFALVALGVIISNELAFWGIGPILRWVKVIK